MKIKQTQAVKNLIKACYPNYKGRKVYLSTEIPNDLSSYWDSGSRDYYVFADVRSGETKQVSTNHPAFEPNKPRTLNSLPSGFLLVKHSIFMGHDTGITIYANESDFKKFLPKNEQNLIEQNI